MHVRNTIIQLLSQVIELLGVESEERRQQLIEEVEQLARARAIQLVLQDLPESERSKLSQEDSQEVEQTLYDNVDEETMNSAFRKAIEEIIPQYIAELSKTGTKTQQKQIEDIISSMVK